MEDFQWGLLWWAQRPPVRRLNYPTWSWLGWKVAIWHAAPQGATTTQRFGVELRIWQFSLTGPGLLFQSSYRSIDPSVANDPLEHVKIQEKIGFHPSTQDVAYAEAEKKGYLLVETVSFDLKPDFSRPFRTVPRYGEHNRYDMAIGNVGCFLYLIGTDPEIHRMSKAKETIYLLLARDHIGAWVCHHLLVVYKRGALSVRGTVMSLFVPDQHLDVLRFLTPKVLRLILA